MARNTSKKKASKKKAGKGKKKGSTTVDFEGVDSGGRAISDGWANLVCKSSELTEAESSGNPMFAVQFEATKGREKATVFDNMVLTPNALWKLRTFLEACGVEVPDGEMDISEDDLVDLECEGEIVNEDYDGRDRPKLVGFRPVGGEEESEEEAEEEETGEEEEEEEEEKPKKGKGKGSSKKAGKGKKLRAGSKVKFEDEDGDTVKGVVTSIDDETVYVEDSDGDEWEMDISDVTAV